VEEPAACSFISQALSKSTTLAMRASEITARSTPLGAITWVPAQKELALSFDVVKNRVCDELDTWVLEPELIDLFDFVVSMGGRDAGFINELLDFACTFVDSKQRQLRLSAFALVNKMPQQTPRAKIAVLMRAYRNMPNKTYCPCPEGWWPREDMAHLVVLEQVLHYLQGTCKSAVADMPLPKQHTFKANTHVLAAEAYARWRGMKAIVWRR
jgi:hypothetical protein